MTHDEYVEILKDNLRKRAVKQAFDFIISKVTFLAWGPLGPLLNFVLGKVIDVFIDQTELATYLLYTDFRVSRQSNNYSDALIANHEAQKNGTPEEKQIAEKNLIDAFRNFVKLTN